MYRRMGLLVIVVCVAALSFSTAAVAATQTVYAGGPPSTKALAAKLLGQRVQALGQANPGINAFFNQTVRIRVGDSVKWTGLASQFHTVDIPAKGKEICP